MLKAARPIGRMRASLVHESSPIRSLSEISRARMIPHSSKRPAAKSEAQTESAECHERKR